MAAASTDFKDFLSHVSSRPLAQQELDSDELFARVNADRDGSSRCDHAELARCAHK
jgi:hypothetical protein